MILRFLSCTFLFCSGLIHLTTGNQWETLNDQSKFLLESSKENLRANFRSKNLAKLSVDTNYGSKIHVRLKQWAVWKILRIFFELARWTKLHHFSSKSPEIREFCWITRSLLLHNTVSRKSRRKKKIVKIFQWSLINAIRANIYTWKTAPKTKLK